MGKFIFVFCEGTPEEMEAQIGEAFSRLSQSFSDEPESKPEPAPPEEGCEVEPAKPAKTRKSSKTTSKKTASKKGPTQKDAQEAFAQVLAQCDRDTAKGVLAKFKALKFSGIDPKDYGAFIEACQEVLEADE